MDLRKGASVTVKSVVTGKIKPQARPFKARGSRVERCSECLVAKPNCICEYRHPVTADVSFWLLMHRKEQYKPTNTGRLIGDILPSSRFFIWHRTEPDNELISLLDSQDHQVYLVFPPDDGETDRVQPIPVPVQSGKPIVFLLLDGTWRQARKIYRQSNYLQRLPLIQLSAATESNYGMRKALMPHHLCTVEVAIQLLEQTRQEQAGKVLQQYFDVFNRNYRFSRGQH